MSDHADTIRRLIDQHPTLDPDTHDAALAALDALLAERQQAQEEMDEILKDRARLADVVRSCSKERAELKAERQQAQEEQRFTDELIEALKVERQQAIEALRENLADTEKVERKFQATRNYAAVKMAADAACDRIKRRSRAALAKLGEAP